MFRVAIFGWSPVRASPRWDRESDVSEDRQIVKGDKAMLAKFNKIFLAVLFLFIVAACEDSKVREAEYLDRAKRLIVAQDYTKARIELRNVLQINPKSAEALYNMAKIEKASLNIAAAISLYRRALLEDPNFIPAIDEIGQLYLAANQQSKTQEQIDKEIEFDNDVELEKTFWRVLRDKKSVNNLLVRFSTKDSFHRLKVNDIIKFGRVNFKLSIIQSKKLNQNI